mgnify:CR=1 FL=1
MPNHEALEDDIYSYKSIKDIKKDIKNAAEFIKDEKCIIIKNAISKSYCKRAIKYFEKISSSSFPNYFPLNKDTPNHFRLNYDDERASVKGHFMQFNIFLKNQDILDTANVFKEVFKIKDKISFELNNGNFFYDSFLPSDKFISRVGYQFYESGKGYLEEHRDFVGENQKVVPSLIISKKGKDFYTGGFFFKKENGRTILPEEYAEVGDLIIFRPDLIHGVELIDKEIPKKEKNYLNGRWMAFITTTKMT